MSQRTSKRKVGATHNDDETSLGPCETQTSKKSKNKSDAKANLNTAGRTSARGNTRKRKIEGRARGETTQEDDECGEPKADAKVATSTTTHGEGEKDVAKRARRAVVNHRINSALLQKARLLEKNVLPDVDLHYVIDRRLNQTDIEWKLRSTAIGLVVQLPYGLGEGPRRKLLDDVRGRILAQSKDTKRRTTLAVLKKANMVTMRAKFGGMRYTAVQAYDNSSYMVLGNLPDHAKVAQKLAELKARIVPLLVQFNVELRELKEIVAQSLRGRIFTNKDHAAQHGGRVTARIDLRVRQFTNLEKLRSDRGLMITLIHELAHAITPSDVKQVKGRGKVKMSHGPLFWENVMRIAKAASEIEDPTWNRHRCCGEDVSGDESEEGGEGAGRRQQQQGEEEGDGAALDLARQKRVIFEVKDELEFRKKIEQEDSLAEELGDDDDNDTDLAPPPPEEVA